MQSHTRQTGEGKPKIIAFINSRSGEGQGLSVMRKLQRLLGVGQVYDLSEGGPEPGLKQHVNDPGVRLVVCGGDGSICWVHSCLDVLFSGNGDSFPPVGILPLGTGNDLARVLGWGGGYENESLSKIVDSLSKSPVASMDRWKVACSPLEPENSAQAKNLV